MKAHLEKFNKSADAKCGMKSVTRNQNRFVLTLNAKNFDLIEPEGRCKKCDEIRKEQIESNNSK